MPPVSSCFGNPQAAAGQLSKEGNVAALVASRPGVDAEPVLSILFLIALAWRAIKKPSNSNHLSVL
jgi:hypothetical protein